MDLYSDIFVNWNCCFQVVVKEVGMEKGDLHIIRHPIDFARLWDDYGTVSSFGV